MDIGKFSLAESDARNKQQEKKKCKVDDSKLKIKYKQKIVINKGRKNK